MFRIDSFDKIFLKADEIFFLKESSFSIEICLKIKLKD